MSIGLFHYRGAWVRRNLPTLVHAVLHAISSGNQHGQLGDRSLVPEGGI